MKIRRAASNFFNGFQAQAVGMACAAALLSAPAAWAGATHAPLYLVTYDHGGAVLWGVDQFRDKVRDAVGWLERHPRFKIGLDNEAYTYDYLAEHDPKLLEELREDLRKYRGRFGIATCTYGQPLSTFLNEESNIRQILYAVRTDRQRLGYTPTVYAMSEHALHSQLPQILVNLGFKGALLRTHFMMYGFNPTFDVPVGWWVGLDGSRIPAVPTYHGEGAEFGRTTIDNWFLTRYPGPAVKVSPEDYRQQFARITPLLASRLDDSGLRKEALVDEADRNPACHWLLLEELFGTFPAPVAELKTLPNDFQVRMPWGYCGNEIWNRNRQAEAAVLTAERLAAIESLLGGTNHEPELEHAWKNLLVGQHHDVQIVGLLPEARRFLSASLAASTNVRDAALQFLASRMKGNGFAQVTVFNPLSWRRQEWIEVNVTLPRGATKALAVQHGNRTVPASLLRADRSSRGDILEARLAFWGDLPALSVEAFSVVAATNGVATAQPETVEVDMADLRIRTPSLDARLDPHGGLAALLDRRTGAPLLEPGKRSGFFAGRINGVEAESHGRWSVHPVGERAEWAVAREDGFVGGLPYTLELTFRADRMDCRVRFHFEGEKIGQLSNDPRDGRSAFVHEDKLRFKLFPAAGERSVGVRDLPFAIAETTNRCVQGVYWTAVAGDRGGIALFNRGTMGSVRERDGGFSLPLAFAMYYIWGTRMLSGDFTYEFAIDPFTGDWRKADLHRRALAYNFSAVSTTGKPGDGTFGEEVQPLRLDAENVMLSALYRDDGKTLARFYEYQGTDGTLKIGGRNGDAGLSEVDFLGWEKGRVSGALAFRPWQIRTVEIQRLP